MKEYKSFPFFSRFIPFQSICIQPCESLINYCDLNYTCGVVNTSSATFALTDPVWLTSTMATAIVGAGACKKERIGYRSYQKDYIQDLQQNIVNQNKLFSN